MFLLRLIRWMVFGALALCILVFALSNRQLVTVSLFPFDTSIALPFYAFFFTTLILGVLLGGIFTLLEKIKEIRMVRHKDGAIKALRNEVEALKTEKKIAGTYQKSDNTAGTALIRSK